MRMGGNYGFRRKGDTPHYRQAFNDLIDRGEDRVINSTWNTEPQQPNLQSRL